MECLQPLSPLPAELPPGTLIVTVPKVITVRADSETRESTLGTVRHIRMWAANHERLTWREIWEAFARLYPGKWAVQVFPPADQLVDGKAVYHLFVCETAPEGLNVKTMGIGEGA